MERCAQFRAILARRLGLGDLIPMLGVVLGLGLAVGLGSGCTRRVSLSVELVTPATPDPFVGVEVVRLSAYTRGLLVVVGEGRWDQGPIAFAVDADPEVEYLVVEGVSASGETLASGVAGPLDVLRTPPASPLQLYFSSVGVLSRARETGEVVAGRKAIALADGRVLFAGGTDADGCEVLTTEIMQADFPRLLAGPSLPSGRADDFELVAMGDETSVAVVGGTRRSDCQTSVRTDEVLAIDLETGAVTAGTAAGRARAPGVAVAPLTDRSILLAGGDLGVSTSSAVMELRLDDFQLVRRGFLDQPRAYSAVVPLDSERIAFVGGRSRARDASSAIKRVSVFATRGGSVLGGSLDLAEAVDQPAALLSEAGSVFVGGGVTKAGLQSREIAMVVMKRDFEAEPGDVTRIVPLPEGLALGRMGMVGLGDGRVLLLPSASTTNAAVLWVLDPLRKTVVPVDMAVDSNVDPEGVVDASSLSAARLRTGLVALRDQKDHFFTFNPGLSAAIGFAAQHGDLSEAAPPGGGIFPRRPRAWRQTERGLEGAVDNVSGSLVPDEYAMISATPIGDFDLRFKLRWSGQAKAAVLVAVDESQFEYVVLHGTTQVDRAPSRVPRPPLECNAATTRSLAEPGEHTVVVSRAGSVVSVDVDADGRRELTCDTGRSSTGFLGLAAVTGTVAFDKLELRRR
ncbi:MAG: hypothetical protein H6729_10170 [Deltaproteobacteria bacterium]|nr:hypothetical protein [Deltaproteobacteria bacterium]